MKLPPKEYMLSKEEILCDILVNSTRWLIRKTSGHPMMKKIEAIVPSSEMRTTFDALEKMGINFSYCDIKGRGQTPMGEEEFDMGSGRVRVREEFKTNVFIMTVVNDSMEEKVIDMIRKNSNAHGKIFVSELKDAIDIRSGQHGESVVQK
jgi:nitrogen regulatory protein P-II 1